MKNSNSACPVCGGNIILPEGIEVSEILTCKECGNRVVVEKINEGGSVVLNEAPKIEEDWGQ